MAPLKKSNQSGFTLLEVIIAITILAFISVFTANAIQRGLRAKQKIEKDLDQKTMLRDALRVVADDIGQAFNYKDIHVALFNLAQQERKKRAQKKSKTTKPKDPNDPKATPPPTTPAPTTPTDPNKPVTPPKEYKLKESVVYTQFQGEGDSIHFSTLSNIRPYMDAQISDQAEISYTLRTCKNRINKKKQSQCLWRRKANIIDKEPEEGGTESVLLENVSELSFRYLGKGKDVDWIEKWKSGEGSDETTKGKFPQAVEITIEVHEKDNKSAKPIKMSYVAPLRFPDGVELAENKEQEKGLTGENQPPTK